MLSMSKRQSGKLNLLERTLPQGFVVDAAWLSDHDYSTSLRSQYVSAGWLEQPARRVYRRPLGALTWRHVVASLQTLLGRDLIVGGRTALDLQGYAHFLSQAAPEVHLYGPKAPPSWIGDLPLDATFRYHNSDRLFPRPEGEPHLPWNSQAVIKWGGESDAPMFISSAERAILELLDELPDRESFDQVDALMEGLTSLSPHRLQDLLAACRSVKVKRLFFFFADRHRHAWLKPLKMETIDLGRGKRVLVRGGKLDPTYQITVPGDLNGVR
jgi:hypothetical protein